MHHKHKEGIVFLNGKFIPAGEGCVAVSSPGFLYGVGLFETMRAYNNRIVYFDAHLERLKRSAQLLKIRSPYTSEKLKAIIDEAVRISRLKDARIRLTLWKREKGADILVTAGKYQPYSLQKYNKGLRACVASLRQNERSPLARMKTTSYLLYRLSYAQAKEDGFDEAVILNNKGYIAEASRSNLFFIKDKDLFTPSLECGCLDGVTRRVVFDLAGKYNIKVYERGFTLTDLYACDEAFLTNSLMGIMPLASVGNIRLGCERIRHKLTRFFMGEYRSLLRDEDR